MSQTLKNLIDAELRSAFGADIDGSDKLANAIAKAVQTYLLSNVSVAPGQVVVTAGSPSTQTGATTTPGTLIAP
jgi:hypothetical protein